MFMSNRNGTVNRLEYRKHQFESKMSGKLSKSKLSPKVKDNSAHKGKPDKAGKSSPKPKEVEAIDLDESGLSLPELSIIDATRDLPRYTSVVGRSECGMVGLEDIDLIQLELEVLLKSAVRRDSTLSEELQNIASLEGIERKRKASPGKPMSPSRKSKSSEEKPVKKMKDNAGKPKDSMVPSPGPSKLKPKPGESQLESLPPLVLGPPPAPPAPPGPPSSSTPSPIAARNDVASRFWTSVETHCGDITEEDVQNLESQLKVYEEDGEYYKIPPLGKHYALRWAHEDVFQQQKEGKLHGDHPGDADSKILRRVEQQSGSSSDAPSFGPLAQRFVSALIEQNFGNPMDENMEPVSSKDTDSLSTNKVMKAFKVSSPQAFEKRVRKELEDQGILDPNDDDDDSDDEILTEMKACQEELKTLASHNKRQLQNLLVIAKRQMNKQKLESQLKHAENEVIETYRRLQGYRAKKRVLTKKEKEMCWKVLHDRESIWQQLQSL